MKKKKFLALLLTGAMALAALTGCSSGTETTEESTGGDASAESGDGAYKIALIQQHQTNAFQIGVTEGAQAKADELGVELNILSADQDAAKQISQIEQCVSEGYDAILFEPVDPDGLRDAAKAAADAGVIMINIVSACTDWESAGISAVSCGDNVKAGENEMQHVADLLDGRFEHIQRQQVCCSAEQRLLPPVIAVLQQPQQKALPRGKLLQQVLRAALTHLLQVGKQVAVGKKRIVLHSFGQPLTGKFGALGAELRTAMFQTAPDDGAGLVPRPSAAAGTAILHLVNGTQSAAEPAQTEGRVGAQVIFHGNRSFTDAAGGAARARCPVRQRAAAPLSR